MHYFYVEDAECRVGGGGGGVRSCFSHIDSVPSTQGVLTDSLTHHSLFSRFLIFSFHC